MSEKKFYLKDKVILKYRITTRTGLRIGSGGNVYSIGEPDLTVVKDPITREPYVPGSSIKGKIRALLERRYINLDVINKHRGNKNELEKRGFFSMKEGGEIVIFVGPQIGDDVAVNERAKEKLRTLIKLFGMPVERAKGADTDLVPRRMIITDAFLYNEDGESADGIIEYKSEAAIDRITAAANPRTSERVAPGTTFEGYIILDIYEGDKVGEFLELLDEGFRLLAHDYLGGAGSRGYGRVNIELHYVGTLNRGEDIEREARNFFGEGEKREYKIEGGKG